MGFMYFFIQSRYANEVTLQDLNLEDADLVNAQRYPHKIPFPRYGRATKKDNINQTRNSAGYPDYLLFDPHRNSAAYTDKHQRSGEKEEEKDNTSRLTSDQRSSSAIATSEHEPSDTHVRKSRSKRKQVNIAEQNQNRLSSKVTSPVILRWSLCCEIKTPWSYNTGLFEEAISGLPIGPDGRFIWVGKSPATKLMKQVRKLLSPTMASTLTQNNQIWGELYSYQTRWGFTTNSSEILLYVKTDRNELVVGDLLPMNQGIETVQTLAGLLMASIDEIVRPWLRRYLCDGSHVHLGGRELGDA